jgi:hypothetical protein
MRFSSFCSCSFCLMDITSQSVFVVFIYFAVSGNGRFGRLFKTLVRNVIQLVCEEDRCIRCTVNTCAEVITITGRWS